MDVNLGACGKGLGSEEVKVSSWQQLGRVLELLSLVTLGRGRLLGRPQPRFLPLVKHTTHRPRPKWGGIVDPHLHCP